MDPLDPLTEIVRSGQAYSSLIFIERLIWLMIGFFFLGAITTSLKNSLKEQEWFNNKIFFIGLRKSDKKNTSIANDSEENINQK